jgi:hypothetical protein
MSGALVNRKNRFESDSIEWNSIVIRSVYLSLISGRYGIADEWCAVSKQHQKECGSNKPHVSNGDIAFAVSAKTLRQLI